MKPYLPGIFLVKLFFVVAVTGHSQTGSCGSFKKGTFAYRDSAANIVREFKRSGKHQVQTDQLTGITTRYRIEWLSDCEYKLTQLYANSKEARKMNGSWMIYRIVSTTANSYTFQCTCNDRTEFSATVVRME